MNITHYVDSQNCVQRIVHNLNPQNNLALSKRVSAINLNAYVINKNTDAMIQQSTYPFFGAACKAALLWMPLQTIASVCRYGFYNTVIISGVTIPMNLAIEYFKSLFHENYQHILHNTLAPYVEQRWVEYIEKEILGIAGTSAQIGVNYAVSEQVLKAIEGAPKTT